ncbi:hypothetical protein [Streptomyces lancefieldiae]|uniref:hypothetical protein n=1 Tax=Streptomyces lancefieldiae TaxID=3075520 RepID=UPI00288ABA48|nr:hypothetical protein [Streptomyces sp. DSM 40712]
MRVAVADVGGTRQVAHPTRLDGPAACSRLAPPELGEQPEGGFRPKKTPDA